jgi:hypothetical protein
VGASGRGRVYCGGGGGAGCDFVELGVEGLVRDGREMAGEFSFIYRCRD